MSYINVRRPRDAVLVCALFFIISLCAAQGASAEGASVYDDVYNEANLKDGVRIISYDQFMDIRNSGEGCVLLDVLSRESYASGHIEGALSLPLDNISRKSASKLFPKDAKLIVYCASSQCRASTMAAQHLQSLGYKVLDYKGGLKEWQEKGNNLVKVDKLKKKGGAK